MRHCLIQALVLSLIFPLVCCTRTAAKDNLEVRLRTIAAEKHLPTLSVRVRSSKVSLEFKYQAGDKGIKPIGTYGLASTTKLLSAILVLKMAEDHQLSIDDPIDRYVDSNAFSSLPWFHAITIRHLLNHTSGIADYTRNADWINRVIKGQAPETFEAKMVLADSSRLTFGIHAYSNTNYIILQNIVETIGGKDGRQLFNDFYRTLGLPAIGFPGIPDGNQAFFAQAAESTNDVSAWQEHYGFDGGAYCRAEELSAILKKVFVDKSVLNAASLALLTTWTDVGQYKIDYGFAQMNGYGLGLMRYMFNGRTFWGHAGSSLKYQSFAFIEPASGAEIILQTNCSGKYYNNVFFIDLIGEILKAI